MNNIGEISGNDQYEEYKVITCLGCPFNVAIIFKNPPIVSRCFHPERQNRMRQKKHSIIKNPETRPNWCPLSQKAILIFQSDL